MLRMKVWPLSKITANELREGIILAIADTLDNVDMTEVADAISGAFFEEDPDWLDKAKNELHNSMRQTLRKLVRLATRLDYLEKNDL